MLCYAAYAAVEYGTKGLPPQCATVIAGGLFLAGTLVLGCAQFHAGVCAQPLGAADGLRTAWAEA
ncbi:MAG: hypothetical protein ACREMA_20735 [Longimicrobiales bacterium]